jgi:hypothetical protein
MSDVMPDNGTTTLQYLGQSSKNNDRNDYLLTTTFRWSSASDLACYAAGHVDWAFEFGIYYQQHFDRKIWNVSFGLPARAGAYIDTTASDSGSVTGLGFGIFRPDALSAGKTYTVAYNLFLPNSPTGGRHPIFVQGKVLQRDCSTPSTWCVGVNPLGRRASTPLVGYARGFAAKGKTCWAWRPGKDPVSCGDDPGVASDPGTNNGGSISPGPGSVPGNGGGSDGNGGNAGTGNNGGSDNAGGNNGGNGGGPSPLHVPSGAVLTTSRGGSNGGGASGIVLTAAGLDPGATYPVGCWETSDSSGNGGSQVASFSFTTDGSGGWSGSGCSTSDSAYTNLRIGPNLVWSNTLAAVPPQAPSPPPPRALTISQGAYAGGSQWWVNLVITSMSPNTAYQVQCWQTTDPTGNGGSRVATFTVTTDGAGNWSGSNTCTMSNASYINLRIGPNIIWSNTIHF